MDTTTPRQAAEALGASWSTTTGADMPYTVIEITKRIGSRDHIRYQVVADVTNPRPSESVYVDKMDAQTHAHLANSVPSGYYVSRQQHPARSIKSGWYWEVTNSAEGFRCTDGQGTIDNLIRLVREHHAKAPERAAKAVEAAAEAELKQAERAYWDHLRAQKGELATERQVQFILTLLEQRELTGEGGGFYSGPTTEREIREMSKREATLYITSLKGDY